MEKLDLHKKRHRDARREVIRFLEDNWDAEKAEIITGRSQRMRAEVIDVLKEYNLDFTIGDVSGFNAGYITVYW